MDDWKRDSSPDHPGNRNSISRTFSQWSNHCSEMYRGHKQLLLVFIINNLFVRRVLIAEEFISCDMINICRHTEENILIYRVIPLGGTELVVA
jgi:hypothetical protein